MSDVVRISHWVYIIARRDDGGPVAPVKVGLSSSPRLRLATIATSCPFPIIGVHAFKIRERRVAEEIEATFHRYQSAFRLHGEWFDIDPVSAVHLLRTQIRAQYEFHAVPEEHIASAMIASLAEEPAVQVIQRLRRRASLA